MQHMSEAVSFRTLEAAEHQSALPHTHTYIYTYTYTNILQIFTYIYNIYIYPKRLQFAAYGQFVLVFFSIYYLTIIIIALL